jgi:outer membrane protein assembly factor BamB
MLSFFPRTLLRFMAGAMIGFALLCPTLWGEPPSSGPKVLTSLWRKHVHAQLTGLDLTSDGQTVAFTTAPASLASDGDSRLHVYDLTGRELWTAMRGLKILGVSLSDDGQHVAIGTMDFSIALFTRDGKLLWERQSVGLPYITPQGKSVVTLNSGITGPLNTLLEVFHRDGQKVWSLRRKGRVWRSTVSDQSDLLMGLWNGEILLIDRQHRIAWQQALPQEIMALAMSPEDAEYFAVGAGVVDPVVHLYQRKGRLVWQRKLPLGVTELSLARQGEFLLSYGNTIHGQHLALYRRTGELEWTYHLDTPATESSKAVIVPDYPLIIAGIERDQRYYVQGFALTGHPLWVAPVPEPIFDFRVSRDGRYLAAATDTTLYFFDTRQIESQKAEVHR